MTRRDADAMVRRRYDLIVEYLHECRVLARRTAATITEKDAAAAVGPVVSETILRVTALPWPNRVRAADVVVVDANRARQRAARLVDADVVLNAAGARIVDHLVPR